MYCILFTIFLEKSKLLIFVWDIKIILENLPFVMNNVYILLIWYLKKAEEIDFFYHSVLILYL